MKTTPDMDVSDNWPIQEVAELHKKEFVEIVRQLARLRDLHTKGTSPKGLFMERRDSPSA
jgi:hypothetical protein